VVVLGAGVLAAGVSTGWLLRDRVVATVAVERATLVSTPVPGTSVSVTTGSDTIGKLVAMDSSRVRWIPSEARFEDGRRMDGARDGSEPAPTPLGDFGYTEP
jgi:hypothetical protein